MSTYLILATIIVGSVFGVFIIVGRKIKRGSGIAHGTGVSEGINERKDQRLVYPDFNGTNERKEHFIKIRNIFRFGEGDRLFIATEKFFRKVRVQLMKLENWLMGISNRIHEKVRQKRASRMEEGKEVKKEGSDSSLIALNQMNTEFDENYWIRVLKEDAKSPYPYKKLGEIYLARGYFKEAREVLRCALKLNPEDLETKAKFEELRGKRTKRVKTA